MKTAQVLLVLLGVSNLSLAQVSRNVDWIHGIGGDQGSWAETAQLFQQERLINTSINTAYETGEGIGFMANQVQAESQGVSGNNLIAITHSMGGVASRQVDVNNTGHFGAIITFGSPLRGARIVDAVVNGEINTFISRGTYQLAQGPATLPVITPIIILGYPLLSWFENRLVRQTVNSLSLRGQTIDDLREESPYNQQFYGNATPTPKLMLWGEEDNPILPRLAAGFQGGDEQEAVDSWDNARQGYGTGEDICHAFTFIPIIGLAFIPAYQAWRAGHQYMLYEADGQWRTMIGASFTQTYSYSVWLPFLTATYQELMYCAENNLIDGDCPYMYQIVYHYSYFVNTPTDGVVPVRSAIAENTAWRPDDPNRIRLLEHNNHQEMRRSAAGRRELSAAFEGNFGDAFRIGRRP